MDILFSILFVIPFVIGLPLQSSSREDYDEQAESTGPAQPHYIDEADIVDAEIASGEDRQYHLSYQTAILLTLDIGRDFQPELMIGGDFKKDWDNHDGEGDPPLVKPLEWGSNFKVDELAARGGVTPLFYQDRDENVIRDEVIEGLIGQTIVYCRYVYNVSDDGLGDYTRYDRVRFPANYKKEAEQKLKRNGIEDPTREEFAEKCIELASTDLEDNFLNDYEAGYVSDYVPEEMDTGESDSVDTDSYSGDGAPEPKSSAWDSGGGSEDEESFEPSDDLPF